jgi:hypothetical protein
MGTITIIHKIIENAPMSMFKIFLIKVYHLIFYDFIYMILTGDTMIYELFSSRIELHFEHEALQEQLKPFLSKKKADIHIYLNWMPFDAFILAMIDTKEGISYAINYETYDVYLRTKSKDLSKETLLLGLSQVIRALSYPLYLIPIKKEVYIKAQTLYLGYTHLLKDIETYQKLDKPFIGIHKKGIALYPDVLNENHNASYYRIQDIHILDDMPFPTDNIEAMRYVMPYLEMPRKAHDLKVFQETLKPIKALPKKMI